MYDVHRRLIGKRIVDFLGSPPPTILLLRKLS